jgi:hypothetical protein
MPDNPEADPLYRLIELGDAEFGMREGKTYLILARRFPTQKEYAQRAHGIFAESTSKQFLDGVNDGGMLIIRADAARALGDMHDYLNCLEEGLPRARQTGNQRQITKVIAVLQKAPRKWRNEKQYKDLEAIIQEIMTPTKIRR